MDILNDSILDSIKQPLGASPDDTTFDPDIIIHINGVFMTLAQLGVGPDVGFYISDNTALWGSFVSDKFITEAIKSYMYIRVRLIFDPPASSVMVAALEKSADQYEWRIVRWAESHKEVI